MMHCRFSMPRNAHKCTQMHVCHDEHKRIILNLCQGNGAFVAHLVILLWQSNRMIANFMIVSLNFYIRYVCECVFKYREKWERHKKTDRERKKRDSKSIWWVCFVYFYNNFMLFLACSLSLSRYLHCSFVIVLSRSHLRRKSFVLLYVVLAFTWIVVVVVVLFIRLFYSFFFLFA